MPISLIPSSRTAARGAALLAAAALLGACDGSSGPSQPVPGELVVRVETPNPDRGLYLQITGPEPITAVSAADPADRAFGSTGSTTIKAAVFGASVDGDVLRIAVADVGRARSYTATVLEATGDDNQLRPSLQGYSATVSR